MPNQFLSFDPSCEDNVNACLFVIQQMKTLSLQAIISRRKSNTVQTSIVETPNQEFDKCINKHFREVNDETIDELINIAIQKQPFGFNQKMDVLQIIAKKTTIALKKQELLSRMKIAYYPGINDLQLCTQKERECYFVLKGQLIVYQRNQEIKNQSKFNTQPISHQQEQKLKFATLEEFQKHNQSYQLLQTYQQFRGIGRLFNLPLPYDKVYKIVAVDAVLVHIKQPQQSSEIVVDGISYEQKLELISHFPILKTIGKKLLNLVHSFKMKHYNLKEVIYQKGDVPQSVFFVIKGEVGFQLLIQNQNKKGIPLITQTISQACYFGQQDILFKSNRSHTAKALTSKCIMLELDRQKFEKLLQNQQFSNLVQRAAEVKMSQRRKKHEKAKMIMINREQSLHAVDPKLTDQQLKSFNLQQKNQSRRRFSTLRGHSKNVKVLHGNLVRQCQIDNSKVQFSMLRVNPDHYEATKDKFRKYNVKQYKEQPKSAWNFKKLWRILNLQDVLRQQQVQLGNKQGLKFFETHRRLQYQISESKSVRPKTTSSSYRTKMQYIAYLQQFNH